MYCAASAALGVTRALHIGLHCGTCELFPSLPLVEGLADRETLPCGAVWLASAFLHTLFSSFSLKTLHEVASLDETLTHCLSLLLSMFFLFFFIDPPSPSPPLFLLPSLLLCG